MSGPVRRQPSSTRADDHPVCCREVKGLELDALNAFDLGWKAILLRTQDANHSRHVVAMLHEHLSQEEREGEYVVRV